MTPSPMTDAPHMPNTPEARRAGAVLTVDLDAVVSNWKTCAAQSSTAECGAVVKATSYGVGAERIAPALQNAGCETFFVATIDEGINLRGILGGTLDQGPAIHVFNGLMDGAERDFTEFGLTPVLNSLGELDAWRAFCTGVGKPLACNLHIDTGMSRLGMPHEEVKKIFADPDHLTNLKLDLLLSHLAVAEDPDDPMNDAQLAIFQLISELFPTARASLANSSGIFLGSPYHYDVMRPGAALYGVNPTPNDSNPMSQVVRLQAKILQVRTIDTPQSVGYGATYKARGVERIATIAMGYADGYHRSLSNCGVAYIGDHKAPIVGRVSMDLITLDVSEVPEDLSRPGMLVDLIGPNNPVDDVAQAAGTIGYEVLTSLGARYHRVYVGGEV